MKIFEFVILTFAFSIYSTSVNAVPKDPVLEKVRFIKNLRFLIYVLLKILIYIQKYKVI